MKKLMSGIIVTLVGILVFALPASAKSTVERPSINLSHEGGKVAAGVPIRIDTNCKSDGTIITYYIDGVKKKPVHGNTATIFAPDEIGAKFSVYVQIESHSPKTWAWKIRNFEVVSDITPPSIYISHFGGGTLKASDEILVAASDDTSAICRIAYSWDNGKITEIELKLYEDLLPISVYNVLSSNALKPETHVLKIWGIDEAENVSEKEEYTFKIFPQM